MLSTYDLSFYPHLAGGAAWIGPPGQDPLTAWLWTPTATHELNLLGTPDIVDALRGAGWEPLEHPVTQAIAPLFQLWGQLADVRLVAVPGQPDEHHVRVRPAHIQPIQTPPVPPPLPFPPA